MSQLPNAGYVPHGDYANQGQRTFHKPFTPGPINIGVPLQPLRPIFDRGLRREDWRPPSKDLPPPPSPQIIIDPAPTMEEKPRFLQPPPRPTRPALRTSLQCCPSPYKSQFSPYNGPNSATFETARTFFTRYFIEWWMLEIISWSFSALCMATILGVLSFYDGKELPQWFGGITLNGFISVFSGLAKAALLLPTTEALGQLKWNWFQKGVRTLLDFEIFDAATRGPWGAFLLLGRLKKFTLASIGAVIILFALPLDLFFQQIIMYPSVWVQIPARPTTPRTVSYLPPNQMFMQRGSSAMAKSDFLNTAMEPSFFSSGSIPELDTYCPTSNCTWEPFQTLGVCVACDDTIGQELSFGCYDVASEWANESNPVNASTFVNMTACGYWVNATSESRILMTGYSVDPVTQLPGQALQTRILPLINEMTREAAYGRGSLHFQHIKNPIVDFFVVNTPGPRGNVYQNVTPVAHECVLRWCVQTVDTSFFWGKQSQNMTAAWAEDKAEDSEFEWDVQMEAGELLGYEYKEPIELTPPSIAGDKVDNGMNLTFGLDNQTMLQTSFLMDNFAPLFVTLESPLSPQAKIKYNIPEVAGSRQREIVENPWVNATQHIEFMAQIMTNAIRSEAGNTGRIDTMNGTAWDLRVHVSIRWPWMIMPAALLFLSLILLTGTVYKSTKEEKMVGIFKNSALAILFNGVGDEVQRSVGPNCRMGRAREMANGLLVKLSPE